MYFAILAITEGRAAARGEVGMASIDIFSPSLSLCQLTDCNSYIGTLMIINVLNPNEVSKFFRFFLIIRRIYHCNELKTRVDL